jgi:integrase
MKANNMKAIDFKEDAAKSAFRTILQSRRGNDMARRRYQKGQLLDDGDRWMARWREDVIDPLTGKVKRVRKSDVLASKKECPTRRLAQRKLEDKLREVNSEDYKPVSVETFTDFASRWEKTVMIHHKPSTQVSERSHINVHLKPAFADFPLKEISAEILQAWVSSQTAAPKTVRNLIATLQTMWTTARAWGYVSHDPFYGLKLPKKVAPKTYSFSLDETLAIIEKAKEPWKTLFRIVAETGVRSGEVAGLRVEDFDPINLTISVRQSVWNRKIQTVKTTTALRREPISVELAAAVSDVIANGRKNEYGLIFTGQTGQPLQMIHFMNRVFRPLLTELGIRQKVEALGIKQCGLHALRRMSGTQMDKMGVPLKTRQARLGHASITTTMYHYTEAIDEASRTFADRMGVLLRPKREGERVQ